MTLSELGEEKLLARLTVLTNRDPRVVGSVTDDCAALEIGRRDKALLLLKTDAVVEGIHFQPNAPPAAVGWKAMMRPLSDIAAMSGLPDFALITLAVPGQTETVWVDHLYRGLRRAAARFGVTIVGGETTATRRERMIAVSVAGHVERARSVFRSGGRAGDAIFVTGALGGSLQKKHLKFTPRIEEARWLTAHFSIHAMMDLSDGLGADLPRLARASGLNYTLDEPAVPRARGCTLGQAIADGEDYELLFAVPARERTRLQNQWRKQFPRLRLTCIGELRRKSRGLSQHLPHGYDHFRERG